MKKTATLLCALAFLTTVGCSTADTENTESETNFKIVIDDEDLADSTETTAAETETAVATTTETIAAETVTVTMETIVAESETAMTASAEETSVLESTLVSTEDSQHESGGSLIGTWEYPDGYRMTFLEDGIAELLMDYSWNIELSGRTAYYEGKSCNVNVYGDSVTLEQDGETILRMTAQDGADPEALTGRYLLEDCRIKEELAEGMETVPVYYFDMFEDTLWIVTQVHYQTQDGILRMMQSDSEIIVGYVVQGDELEITDETGVKDILTRVQ